MTLNIYEIEGVFELQGDVTTYNAQQVEMYFEVMLRLKPQVIINLSRLESMDVAGVYAFCNLLNQASKEGKFLRFVGANNFKLVFPLKMDNFYFGMINNIIPRISIGSSIYWV